MSRFIGYALWLVADQRGAVYIEYTSLLLLIAIAAIAVVANHGGVPN